MDDGGRLAGGLMTSSWEQFEGAALALARSGTIKERLTEAYRNHLALVNSDELPDALRAPFRACHDALTHEPPLRGEDAVRATVRKMSNHEADEIAANVVRLFAALLRESSREAAALPEVLVSGAARAKAHKSVPQLISLYAAEA